MNKSLLLIAAASMAAFSASADVITLLSENATDIVFGKDEDGNKVDMTSCKIGDYSFTFEAGADVTASQTPRFWANDKTIRIYKGSKMTVAGPTDMNAIVFSAKSTNACKNFNAASADQGTVVVESPNVTWTAATPAKTMTLILPSDVNANFQIQTITIYTGSDTPGSSTPEVPHATTVAELLNIANGSEFTFEGELTVSYANGPDCYVYDNTGATLLYSSKSDPWVEVLTPGTIITEFSGARNDYSGTAQFNPLMTSLVLDGQTTVKSTACGTADEVIACPIATYVCLTNVDFTLNPDNERYAVATFANGSSINIYNRFCTASYNPTVTFPAAGKYDIYGLRNVYKDDPQVNITSYTAPGEGVATITSDNGDCTIYDLQGRRVNGQPAAGLYIFMQNGKATKVLVK